MIFEYKNTIEIESGLTLQNPKMEIMFVFYNVKTNEFKISIDFWETKFRHQRVFEAINPNPGGLSMQFLLDFISEHPILSQFTIQ